MQLKTHRPKYTYPYTWIYISRTATVCPGANWAAGPLVLTCAKAYATTNCDKVSKNWGPRCFTMGGMARPMQNRQNTHFHSLLRSFQPVCDTLKRYVSIVIFQFLVFLGLCATSSPSGTQVRRQMPPHTEQSYLHCIVLHYNTVPHSTIQYIASHDIAMLTLHYMTWQDITLDYAIWNYIAKRYNKFQYLTLHSMTFIHIHACKYNNICIYIYIYVHLYILKIDQ